MNLAVGLLRARAGADSLALDDDVGEPSRMLMSRAMWQRYFKPHLETIICTCRRANPELAIFWHSDGNIEPIIPDLIEIGVDILNPVQPDVMDPARLKIRYGDRLTFSGTVGTAPPWAWGRPAAIRAAVRGPARRLMIVPAALPNRAVPVLVAHLLRVLRHPAVRQGTGPSAH